MINTTQPTRTVGLGVRPAARMVGLSEYEPPPIDPRITLRLDANEGPALDPALLARLASLDCERVRRYSVPRELERAIAERAGIDPERVVVTNGGDDAIDRVCRATLEPGRSLVRHTPTFSMIERSAALAGGAIVGPAWMDGSFPIDGMLAAIGQGAGLVAVVSPNNPTGGVVAPSSIDRIADAADRAGAALLVDLAYIEFAEPRDDPTPLLLDRPNVIMVRTLSKAFGLAGLRIGYAIAPPMPSPVAGWLRAAGGPFPVSGPSLELAMLALEPSARRDAGVRTIRAERAALIDVLVAAGARPLESSANFVLARFDDAALVREALAGRGIAVRGYPVGSTLGEYLRITLPGDANAFGLLAESIRAACAIQTDGAPR